MIKMLEKYLLGFVKSFFSSIKMHSLFHLYSKMNQCKTDTHEFSYFTEQSGIVGGDQLDYYTVPFGLQNWTVITLVDLHTNVRESFYKMIFSLVISFDFSKAYKILNFRRELISTVNNEINPFDDPKVILDNIFRKMSKNFYDVFSGEYRPKLLLLLIIDNNVYAINSNLNKPLIVTTNGEIAYWDMKNTGQIGSTEVVIPIIQVRKFNNNEILVVYSDGLFKTIYGKRWNGSLQELKHLFKTLAIQHSKKILNQLRIISVEASGLQEEDVTAGVLTFQ